MKRKGRGSPGISSSSHRRHGCTESSSITAFVSRAMRIHRVSSSSSCRASAHLAGKSVDQHLIRVTSRVGTRRSSSSPSLSQTFLLRESSPPPVSWGPCQICDRFKRDSEVTNILSRPPKATILRELQLQEKSVHA